MLSKICNFISKYMAGIVIVVAAMALLVPASFNWISTSWITPFLGLVMFGMGLTLDPHDFKVVFTRPKDIIIGSLAQFLIMPLTAFLLSRAFGLSDELAIGVILVGCCPGGTASNVMTYLAKGDLALSVGMTTVSTVLAPILTPLLTLLYAGERVHVDALGMFLNILIVTLLPVTLGFLANLFWGKDESFKKAQAVMPAFSVLGLACIVGGVIAGVHDKLLSEGTGFFLTVFAVVLCHNSLGYLTGYSVGKLFHFSKAKNRTISIEVGMQNAGLATVLASNFFAITCPLAVIPAAVSCAWHSISGTILATWFRSRDEK